MNKKGFVSSYFLVLLMNVVILIGVIQSQLYTGILTLEHIKKVNKQVISEAKVIAFVKCLLSNHQLEEGYFEIDGCSGYISILDVIRIEISNPEYEIIELEYYGDEIYEMNVIT